nr:hypothetical protein [Tanacetum cinerariifolium]
MALTFSDTHNRIAFLTKSDASERFEQIIDFLNAHVIQYALMVKQTIYVSCIKQFWTSISIKKLNDVVRLQALLDIKKVIITEDSIRKALRLDDADSVDCLPNEEIFAKLARMGYEKLSTKLTFYKAFFLAQWNLVRNVDIPSKFLMYPQFLQLMVNAQIGDLTSHTTKYISPAITQKVFANIRRIGKGFSRVDTLLFDGMLVPQQAQDVENTVEDEDADNETCATLTKQVANLEQDKVVQAIKITKLKQRVKRRMHPNRGEGEITELDADEDVTLEEVDAEVTMDANVQGRLEESQVKVYHLDLEHAEKVLTMQDTDEVKPAKVEEVIEVVTAAKLMTEVVNTAATTITAALVLKASAPRRRRGVIIQDPKEAITASVIMQSEVKSKDKGKRILIEEPKPLKIQAEIEEDLEMLRKLVQERFQSSEPKNFSYDFLLNILKTMFEKPNVKASIWRDQRGRYGLAKVKSWKLFKSCGVHIITLITTQMILLAEKKYPLKRFTLEQMLNNVRLKVEEESEMSLELLSFGVAAIEDFKEYMLRDYCCRLKT